jgi:arabinogalactan oligomer/maltooligosaccharide transport system substrate-binding protein
MNLSNLQIILIAVFIVATIGAVLIFAGIIPVPGARAPVSGQVTIWGTLPAREFNELASAYTATNRNITVNYIQKPAATFDEGLAEALATGTGPDAFLLTTDAILKHRAKVFPIPYASYPESTFRADYASIAELYLTQNGILGVPLVVDPLVMFYNRRIFDNAGVARPPDFWDELPDLVPSLTRRAAASVTQAGVAMGGAGNIANAKEIVSALVLQTGNPVVGRSSDETFEALLDSGESISALSFYTSFANSVLPVYSWNESLPNARNAFTAGNVGIYFGFGSELFTIRDTNPNLDFDVRPLPQIRGGSATTFGRAHALAVSRASANIPATATAVFGLTSRQAAPILAVGLSLPPARRDLLNQPQTGNYLPIFYRSALQARGFFDPDPARTRTIFNRMITDVVSGRADVSGALDAAAGEINLLLNR